MHSVRVQFARPSTRNIRASLLLPTGVTMTRILFTFALSLFASSFAGNFTTVFAEDAAAGKPSVTLKAGTWSDVEKLIKASEGKIVVVDVWSTSCLPCKKEFPNLVKLAQQYPKKIVCVSFNIDYAGIRSKPPEYYRPRVEKFLQEQKATFANYLSTVEAFEFLDNVDLASIPAVYVYGPSGKLARRFDGALLEDGEEEAFTYADDVNPFIATLLPGGKR